MDVNFSTIARDRTAMSLRFAPVLRRGACKTQTFCTASVGPPLHVQNFWRPNALATKNLQRHDPSAHQTPSSKSQNSTSATHFRSNQLETNVQNSRAKSHASRAESQNLVPSTRRKEFTRRGGHSAFHPTVTPHGVCQLQSSPQSLHRPTCAKPR